jgi:2-methylcitrate dehydratase PrpD
VYHGAAIGLVRGKAGLQEYTDAAVNDPAVKRVRESATATGDPSLTEDQARVEVELVDGRVLEGFVEQSLGNVHRPLSDEQLNEKFRAQSVLALPAPQVDAALDLCWRLADLPDAQAVVRASVPAAVASVGGAAR